MVGSVGMGWDGCGGYWETSIRVRFRLFVKPLLTLMLQSGLDLHFALLFCSYTEYIHAGSASMWCES